MALQKQNISLSLTKGLNTKADPKQIVPGEMLTLENAIFKTPGEIIKRNGFNELAILSPLTSGNATTAYNNELIVLDNKNLYSYSIGENSFVNKGSKVAIDLAVSSIIKNTYEQTYPDCAVNGNYKVYVWQDSRGTSRYSLFDTGTNQAIVFDQALDSNANFARVFAFGTYFVLMYGFLSAGNYAVSYKYISTSTPTVISSRQTAFTSTVVPNTQAFIYDAIVINNVLNITCFLTGLLNAVSFDTSFTRLHEVTSIATSLTAGSALTLFSDPSNNLWVGMTGYNSDGSLLRVRYLILTSSTFSVVLANTALDSISTDGTKVGETVILVGANIIGVYANSKGNFYYEIQPNTLTNVQFPTGAVPLPSFDPYIKTNTGNLTGTVGTASVFIRSLGIASKIFTQGSDYYFSTIHSSNLQPTYFILNSSGIVVCKIAPSNSGGLTQVYLPQVTALDSVDFIYPYLVKSLLSSVNGNIYTQTGVNSAIITFNNPEMLQILAKNLHISGGILSVYDGESIVEHGFNIYPEVITPTILSGTGGLSEGQYEYAVTYEWTDDQGQIQKSAPSVPTVLSTSIIYDPTYNAGSPTLANIPTTVLDTFYPGMKVTGVGIGPGDENIISAIASSTSVTMASNATGTGSSSLRTTFIPQIQATYIGLETGDITANNFNIGPQIAFPDFQYMFVEADLITPPSGIPPTTFTVNNPLYIQTGMTVDFLPASGPLSKTVTGVSGNEVSLSSSYTVTTNQQSIVNVSMQFTGSIALISGNNYLISGVPSNVFTWNFLSLGRTMFSSTFSYGSARLIGFNASANTITVSRISGTVTTGSATFFIGFPARANIKIGNSLSGTGIPTGTVVKEIIPFNKVAYNVPPINKFDVLVTDAAFPVSGTITIGNYGASKVVIDTLRVTQKQNVNIVVYRTVANGTVFYRVSDPANPLINDPTVDTFTFYDLTSDFEALGNQQLYTTGGVIENISAPALNSLAEYKVRMVGVTEENPLTIWYSQQVLQGVPVEFNDLFTINVDEQGGPITALQQMDDKLIIFKNNNIFYMVGDGPTPAGTNNDFSNPQIIPTDTGCINRKSVVLYPNGVLYQSAKGIYLLDRSLQVSYIGSPVEQYTSTATITSAKLMPTVTQVRFTLDSGITLVYDYFMQQWSVFTNVNAVDSTIYSGEHTYITPAGIVNQETPGVYTDNSTPININLLTGWFSFAGLQGFERIYKLLILGQYISPHSLNVKFAYDFDTTQVQTTTIPVNSNPSPYYQFRVFPQRQKCDAMQIQITEINTLGGQGLTLSNLTMEMGMKRGTNKITASNSYG